MMNSGQWAVAPPQIPNLGDDGLMRLVFMTMMRLLMMMLMMMMRLMMMMMMIKERWAGTGRATSDP